MIKLATHIQTVWMVLALHCAENLQVVYFPFPVWKLKADDGWLARFPHWSLQTSLYFSGPKCCSHPIPNSSHWPTAVFSQTISISQIQTYQVHLIYSCLHYTRLWFNAHTQTFLPSTTPYLMKGLHTLTSHFYQRDLHHRQRLLIYSCKGGGNKKRYRFEFLLAERGSCPHRLHSDSAIL